jgi:ubiquinone/menaquinone biosynthesis C-methylase UbiE
MSNSRDSMRARISRDWVGAPYYQQAEAWLSFFWSADKPVRKYFDRLDLSRTIELACGHGRHAAQCLDRVGEITLVDVNESNVDHCRARFTENAKVRFMVNNGHDLQGLGDGGYTALYSYDSMVHFDLLDVIDYIRDMRRVLVPGGLALLHVSNNMENPGGFYQQNARWRNFGSVDVVRHVAERLDMPCIAHETMDWGGSRNVDGLVLLERR